VFSFRFALIPTLATLVAGASGAAAAGQSPPRLIAVLDVRDLRPAKLRPADNAVQRAFEEELTRGELFRIVPRKAGQNAVCADDECGLKLGRELGVERVLATRIESEHGECLVHAAILNTVINLPEVIAYRPTPCDQASVLAMVKKEIGPALRREQPAAQGSSPKPELVPLSDKRIVGNWDIKHIGAKRGSPPNLTGAQLRFGADGKYRGDGEVRVDRPDEPGMLSLAGPYGFNGKVLGIRNWGTEFEHCEVMTKKPASFTPSAVDESEFSKKATCKLYFETRDKIWVWYPGTDEGVILDTWTRARRASK
jgi:hypothetical protein